MLRRHAAFLRAINVGGRRVKNDELRSIVTDLGFDDVDTYLASGNLVFGADAGRGELERQLAAHLEDRLGWAVPTFVRTLDELRGIADSAIFAEEAAPAGMKRYVCFVDREPAAEGLDALSNDVDRFAADGHEIYWLRDVDAGESMPTSELEKALDLVATRRTINTVVRMVKKFG